MRTFTTVAQIRALAELSLGEVEAAHRDLLLGLRLADALTDEPILISHIVRISQLDLLMAPLWEGLVRHQWNETQLAAIDEALTKVDLIAGFQRAIRGERVILAVQALDAVKTERHLLFSLANTRLKGSSAAQAMTWLIPTGWIDFNKAELGYLYSRLLKTADPGAHRFLPETVEHLAQEFEGNVNSKRRNPRKMLAALVFPAIVPPHERSAVAQATVDLARCAIAIERFRLKYGVLPENLTALSPDFMSAVPPDVMTGDPLRYQRKTGESFRLYSVGWNRRDDGGDYVGKADADTPRIEWRQGDWPWPELRSNVSTGE